MYHPRVIAYADAHSSSKHPGGRRGKGGACLQISLEASRHWHTDTMCLLWLSSWVNVQQHSAQRAGT